MKIAEGAGGNMGLSKGKSIDFNPTVEAEVRDSQDNTCCMRVYSDSACDESDEDNYRTVCENTATVSDIEFASWRVFNCTGMWNGQGPQYRSGSLKRSKPQIKCAKLFNIDVCL